MYQACAVKQLKPNESIYLVLDNWMQKYNTSPRNFTSNKHATSLAIEYDFKTKSAVEKESLIKGLKEWADKNQKVIFVTSFAILVLTASNTILKEPIISLKNSLTGANQFLFREPSITMQNETREITSGVYYADENNEIISEDNQTVPFLAEVEINEQGEPIFYLGNALIEDTTVKTSVDAMMGELLKQLTSEDDRQDAIRDEEERLSEEKKYIEFYCAVYGLNYDNVYQALSEITNNFTDEAYINNFEIGTSILKGKYVQCNSKEMALLIAVRNIYYDPGRYNCSTENLWTGVEFKTDVDYSHQIGYLSNVLCIDPVINWAICNAECSFKSPLFLNGHNPSGLNFGNGFEHFPSTTAGFIEQSLELVKHKRAGRTTISAIGAVHAPVYEDENGNLVNAHWVPNVTGGYYTASNNYESYFGNTEDIFFQEQSEEDKFISLYSSIYGLNKDKVYQILSDMTDNFTSELYLEHNVIEKSSPRNKSITSNSKEMSFLLAIRNIYQNPEQYGTTLDEIKEDNLYESNQNYAKQIEYFSKLIGVDTSLNYAICQASCGFKSPMFIVKNNPTSIMKDNEFLTFPTQAAGFIEQTIELLEMQIEGSIPMDEIGLRTNYSPYKDITKWNLYVYDIYDYVSSNYDSIFEPSEEIELTNEKVYEFK